MSTPDRTAAQRPESGQGPAGLPAVLALYAIARLGLLAVLAGLLVLAGVPVVVALLVALVVALPLSMFVFRGLRTRLDATLAHAGRRRAAERAALRARLRGDGSADAADSGHRAEAETESRRG